MTSTTRRSTMQERVGTWIDHLDISAHNRREAGLDKLSLIVGPSHAEKTSALDSIALHWKMAASFARSRKANNKSDSLN